nr:MAG TPA: holin [Caudoviricetes sp.]
MEFILKFIVEGWNSLTDSFILKAILSGAAAIAIWVIGIKHVQILGVFILLVFVDLFTKWAAIAYQMLIDEYGYDKDQIAVWEKYRAIPIAFEKGKISSRYMRKGFVFKVATYVAATMAAVLFDEMSGQRQFAVSLVWLYLGSCEFLSIMENLRDGGNAMLGKFLDLIRTKIENKVKL